MISSEGKLPLVSVGIAIWNSEKDLPTCFDGLLHQTYPQVEIIVVDNDSRDKSVELIQEGLPQAKLIRNSGNLGYGIAQNQAIRESHGAYFLPLNPDVRLSPDFIERLVAVLETRPGCGSAVGKFWQPEGARPRKLDAAGLFIDRRRRQYLRGHRQDDHGQYDEPGEVFGADGAAPLHRRSALEDVKVFDQYFDEAYFIYHEDVDLAWRARLLGWRCWYEPGAVAEHDRTFKPGVRRPIPRHLRRMAVRNRYMTILKNEAPECWRRDWWQILRYDFGILGYILLMEQSSLGAYSMLWRRRSRLREWRHEIWSRVRTAAEERLAWFG
jgi:GT2 family glycosyltransferase